MEWEWLLEGTSKVMNLCNYIWREVENAEKIVKSAIKLLMFGNGSLSCKQFVVNNFSCKKRQISYNLVFRLCFSYHSNHTPALDNEENMI